MTLLWLDDLRPAPDGWTWVKSVNEAIQVLQAGGVTHASLDHDLGDYAHDGGDASMLTDWMADPDFGIWPTGGVRLHTANLMMAEVMLRTMDRYGPYPPRFHGAVRGVDPENGWPAVTAVP